ncbi:MAG TPA: hypothetical protein VJZ73_00030 [Methylomirabilota bacterium]|nr:hypothetical protein [Methylomirabilota bacterium]
MPIHEPTHLPEMSVPATEGDGGIGLTGAGIAVAAGALAAGGEAGAGAVEVSVGLGNATGVEPLGVDVDSVGVDVVVDVGDRETVASVGLVSPEGTPVLSVAPATVSAGGVSARDAGGSDELKTEHAASRGIRASTNSTRIEPPLTLPAFICATGTWRARPWNASNGDT